MQSDQGQSGKSVTISILKRKWNDAHYYCNHHYDIIGATKPIVIL